MYTFYMVEVPIRSVDMGATGSIFTGKPNPEPLIPQREPNGNRPVERLKPETRVLKPRQIAITSQDIHRITEILVAVQAGNDVARRFPNLRASDVPHLQRLVDTWTAFYDPDQGAAYSSHALRFGPHFSQGRDISTETTNDIGDTSPIIERDDQGNAHQRSAPDISTPQDKILQSPNFSETSMDRMARVRNRKQRQLKPFGMSIVYCAPLNGNASEGSSGEPYIEIQYAKGSEARRMRELLNGPRLKDMSRKHDQSYMRALVRSLSRVFRIRPNSEQGKTSEIKAA